MRLYLSADSKQNIGYIPDWIRFVYLEDGKERILTLDIHGDIDYDEKCLNCRCKGEFIPWTLSGDDIGEIYLYELEMELSEEKLYEKMKNGVGFVVGIYPDNCNIDGDMLAADVFTDCKGECSLFTGKEVESIHFEFETEIVI